MATLIIPSPTQGIEIENFTIKINLSDDTQKLVIEIIDRYPNVADGILISRRFSYSIADENSPTDAAAKATNSTDVAKDAAIYGLRFIDQKNEDGQRKVIYHFNISIDEFEGGETLPEIFLIKIYTPDANGHNALIYSFEIQKDEDEDDDDDDDDDALTKDDVNKLIDEKIRLLMCENINPRLEEFKGRVDTIDDSDESEDEAATQIKKGKNFKA